MDYQKAIDAWNNNDKKNKSNINCFFFIFLNTKKNKGVFKEELNKYFKRYFNYEKIIRELAADVLKVLNDYESGEHMMAAGKDSELCSPLLNLLKDFDLAYSDFDHHTEQVLKAQCIRLLYKQ